MCPRHLSNLYLLSSPHTPHTGYLWLLNSLPKCPASYSRTCATFLLVVLQEADDTVIVDTVIVYSLTSKKAKRELVVGTTQKCEQ